MNGLQPGLSTREAKFQTVLSSLEVPKNWFLITPGNLFITTKKQIGPNTNPYGTPDFTAISSN